MLTTFVCGKPGQHEREVKPVHIVNLEDEVLNVVEGRPGISSREELDNCRD